MWHHLYVVMFLFNTYVLCLRHRETYPCREWFDYQTFRLPKVWKFEFGELFFACYSLLLDFPLLINLLLRFKTLNTVEESVGDLVFTGLGHCWEETKNSILEILLWNQKPILIKWPFSCLPGPRNEELQAPSTNNCGLLSIYEVIFKELSTLSSCFR